MERIKIIYDIDDNAFVPTRGHEGDAGLDLRTPYDVTIPKGKRVAIDTGVRYTDMPSGYYGKLESKSGLNVKHGIVCLGGILDSGYTGNIVVCLYNLSNEDYTFKRGDKIVQMLLLPYAIGEFEIIESKTDRGTGGFGSTGN